MDAGTKTKGQKRKEQDARVAREPRELGMNIF